MDTMDEVDSDGLSTWSISSTSSSRSMARPQNPAVDLGGVSLDVSFMNHKANFLLLLISGLLAFGVTCLAQEEKKVTLTGNDQMKYDVTAIEVASGQKVTVTVTNGGQLPKTAMAHNFVLLKPGTDVNAFAMAGISQAATDYIAPDQADKVIAKTKFVGPGESDSVTFTAPAPGTYDYICTFPGHAMAGMRGVLTVK